VIDSNSAKKFLVDTGASCSLFPHKSKQVPFGPDLRTPNGTSIPSWGESAIHLEFSGRTFTWNFLLADIEFPILGADFLRHFKLVVDLANGQLLDTQNLECLPIGAVARPQLQTFVDEESIHVIPGVSAILTPVSALPEIFRGIFVLFF
jgi:hypothetical protein